MKTGQLFALFIIGFMAFSTVAFVLSATFNSNPSTSPATTDTNTPAQNLSSITYSAQVDANVLEVFSSFKMAGTTSEFDIAKIDSAIAKLNGITGLKSVFRQVTPQQGAQPVTYYIADVSFDSKKTSFENISTAISEATSGFLGSIGYFPNALIVVPSTLSMQNTDLNLSKNYELKDNVLQSYLNSGTMKGDAILARVEITFSGEQPTSTLSSEISNYSQQVIQHSASLSLPLTELEPKLTFTADANYSDRLDQNQLRNEILQLKDVNSADISVDPIYYKMLLTINKPFNDSLEQDLNKALPKISGVTDTAFYPDQNSLNVIIGFPENSILQPLKDSIAAQLSSLAVTGSSFSFTEPTVSYSGTINLDNNNAKASADSVKALFSAAKFFSKVYQLGRLSVSVLTDQDSKESFLVDSNSIEAAIFPVHNIGDEIFASVAFYSQRGKLLDAKAVEVINPIRLN